MFPTGGASLDYIQYPLGLKLLGHDVYYIEDTMLYPVYQQPGKEWNDTSDCIDYLKKTMEFFGLKDRWAYRDIASGACFGLSLQRVLEICRTADVFINISCSTYMREEYARIPKRLLIDSDPMFTQVQYYDELKKGTGTSTRVLLETHNYLFSFGEHIGQPDCRIPTFNFKWLTTRQPVCLKLWKANEKISDHSFTTIMNWSGRSKLLYENEDWGQKDVEFRKYLEIPDRLPQVKFKVVVNPPLNPDTDFDRNEIADRKWHILNPQETVSTPGSYSNFIKQSFAEFSVAKEAYVKSKSGWFSGRSACYLAAGKPVVVQDTGWSEYIPSGNGLFAFRDMESAVEGIKMVVADSDKHRKAAFEIAAAFFDSNTVLNDMLEKIN